jgi:uncharacterized membrane protein YoaK (UPF0700 family)
LPTSNDNPLPPSPERRAADSLPSAVLLAFTGGSLDAFIYINHGHVFAAAMTGNAVLFGVSALDSDYIGILHHLLPIFAFILGVFFARLLDRRLQRHAVRVGLMAQIVVLFFMSWMPGSFPNVAYVPIVAVVAAYQIASFRKADEYSYNSTFITGNLRSAVEGLYDTLNPEKRADGLRKAGELFFIIASFMTGAVVGAILAPRIFNHTLLVVLLPLLIVLALVRRREKQAH